MSVDRKKILSLVRGYLLKEKRNTVLTSLFLCFVTVFLLIGNQLFANVQTANRLNAEALEGRQHVTYSDISEAEFQKIKACDFVVDAGLSFHLGQAEDGTAFDYIDESFRGLGATVAEANIKQVINGRWAQKEKEIIFTKNYMEKYGLELGDTVSVSLAATDADTGEVTFRIPDLTLTIVGVIDNAAGFTDRKSGYVSEALAEKILREKNGRVNAVVRFSDEEKIPENLNKLNAYLGYGEEESETLKTQINDMLAETVTDGGTLKKQNIIMNFTIWLVGILVVYNIFYNRLFEKKRDFIALRKIGFQTKDLMKIAGMEFLIFILIGFATGILIGYFLNQAVYGEIMKAFAHAYDAEGLVFSELSWDSVGDTAVMLLFMVIPSMAGIMFQLQNSMPTEFMRGKRKNTRKQALALLIVSLSAILISILGIQDNHSDEGILFVKEYVPGDLQVTAGSIYENIQGGDIPSISDSVFREMKAAPGIRQVQDYKINYDRGIFLCEDRGKLNADSGTYESMLAMEQDIDGKKQCLYNLVLATTENMEALAPGYDEKEDGYAAIMEPELAKTLNLEIGDTFTIYDEQLIANGSKEGCKSARVKLLDIRNVILSENHIGGNLLVVDEETARAFPGSLYRQVVNVWTKEGVEAVAASNLERISDTNGYSFRNANRQIQKYVDSDHSQKVMQCFFIIILAVIGLLVYFNTIFTNLLNRRNDFKIMHKIGIRKKEMYWMIMKEGLCQGGVAAGIVVIVQAAWSAGRQETFFSMFAVTDAIVVAACALFPVFILWYMFHKKMAVS